MPPTPLSADEMTALVEAELKDCPSEVCEVFDRYRIAPARMPYGPPTTLEDAFVIARHGDKVIYYEEVEGGFNSSRIDPAGRIADHWFEQDTLRVALHAWMSDESRSSDEPTGDGVPNVDRNHQPMEAALPMVPRWIEVPVGILLALWTLLSVAGALTMLLLPPTRNRLLVIAVGGVMLFVSGWCLDKAIRLVTGRSSHSGLLSPLALRLVSIAFLLLPFGGLFTGYYSRHRLLAITQAVTYFLIFGALQRIARSRESMAGSVRRLSGRSR